MLAAVQRVALAFGVGFLCALWPLNVGACAQGAIEPGPDVVFRGVPIGETMTVANPPGMSGLGQLSTWSTTYRVEEVFKGTATMTEVVASNTYFPTGSDGPQSLPASPSSEIVLANRTPDGRLVPAECVVYDVSVNAIAGRGYPPTHDPEARRWPWVVVGVIASILMVAYIAGLVRIEQRRRAEHRIG